MHSAQWEATKTEAYIEFLAPVGVETRRKLQSYTKEFDLMNITGKPVFATRSVILNQDLIPNNNGWSFLREPRDS